jgi:hypothetical protein
MDDKIMKTTILIILGVVAALFCSQSSGTFPDYPEAVTILDVDSVKTHLYNTAIDVTFGDVTISCETGKVTIQANSSLDEASKQFWVMVEKQFKNNVKIAMRLQLWREIEAEHCRK